MYRYLMECIETEGELPKSRCLVQCLTQIPMIVACTVYLSSHGVLLTGFLLFTIPLLVLPIYRCVHVTSYIQRYTLQIANLIAYIPPGFFLLMKICDHDLIMAAVGFTCVVYPYQLYTCRECKKWLANNDLYYLDRFQKILKDDRKVRYGIAYPLGFCGVELTAFAVVLALKWGQWETLYNDVLPMMAYASWSICVIMERNVELSALKMQFLRRLQDLPPV